LRRLDTVRQWQSESPADLHHFAGVLDRVACILTELRRAVPYILSDGGPVQDVASLHAASRAAHACLRFVALLLRHSWNKKHFREHVVLVAFLAARVPVVADAALDAVAAVLQPAETYVAREDDTTPQHVLKDALLRDRLAVLAESPEGVCNRPARAMRDHDNGGTAHDGTTTEWPASRMQEVGDMLERQAWSEGSGGGMDDAAAGSAGLLQPGDTLTLADVALLGQGAPTGDAAGLAAHLHHGAGLHMLLPGDEHTAPPPAASTLPAEAELRAALASVTTVTPWTPASTEAPLRLVTVSTVQPAVACLVAGGVPPCDWAWRIAGVLTELAHPPPAAAVTLHIRVRRAVDNLPPSAGCLPGRLHEVQLLARRHALLRQVTALAACLRCKHTLQSAPFLVGNEDTRLGEDLLYLASVGVQHVPTLPLLERTRTLARAAGAESHPDGRPGLICVGSTLPHAAALAEWLCPPEDARPAPAGPLPLGLHSYAAVAGTVSAATCDLLLHTFALSLQCAAMHALIALCTADVETDRPDGVIGRPDHLPATISAVCWHVGLPVPVPSFGERYEGVFMTRRPGLSGPTPDQAWKGVLFAARRPYHVLLSALDSAHAISVAAEPAELVPVAALAAALADAGAVSSPVPTALDYTTPAITHHTPPTLNLARALVRFSVNAIQDIPSSLAGDMVPRLVRLVSLPLYHRGHVGVSNAAVQVLSFGVSGEAMASRAIAAALRKGDALERLCTRMAAETDHHMLTGVVMVGVSRRRAAAHRARCECAAAAPPLAGVHSSAAPAAVSTTTVTAAPAAGAGDGDTTAPALSLHMDLDGDIPALELPPAAAVAVGTDGSSAGDDSWDGGGEAGDEVEWRRVLSPFPDSRRELLAAIADVVFDTVSVQEGMTMADVNTAITVGSALLRPLSSVAGLATAAAAPGQDAVTACASRWAAALGLPLPGDSGGGGAGARRTASPDAQRSWALGRRMRPRFDDAAEHWCSDTALAWAVKDVIAFPYAFGGAIMHIVMMLVSTLISSDPTVGAAVWDSGITPMFLRLLFTDTLPPNASLLSAMPTIIANLLLTETVRERAVQLDAARATRPQPPGNLGGLSVKSPLLSSLPTRSPLLVSLQSGNGASGAGGAGGGGLGVDTRRRSSLLQGPVAAASPRLQAIAAAGGAAPMASPGRPSLPAPHPPLTAAGAGGGGGGIAVGGVAVVPGSAEYTVLHADRARSGFHCLHLAESFVRAQVGAWFQEAWWSGLPPPRRVLVAAMYAMIHHLTLGTIPALVPARLPDGLVTAHHHRVASWEATRAFSCHPRAESSRVAVDDDGVPRPYLTNADLISLGNPHLTRVADPHAVPYSHTAPLPRVVSAPDRLAPARSGLPRPLWWLQRGLVSHLLPGDHAHAEVVAHSVRPDWIVAVVPAPQIAGAGGGAGSPLAAAVGSTGTARMAASALAACALGGGNTHANTTVPMLPDADEVHCDPFLTCPAWDMDDASFLAGGLMSVDAIGCMQTALRRDQLADFSSRMLEVIEVLPEAGDLLREALQVRIISLMATLVAVRHQHAVVHRPLSSDAEDGGASAPPPPLKTGRKRRRPDGDGGEDGAATVGADAAPALSESARLRLTWDFLARQRIIHANSAIVAWMDTYRTLLRNAMPDVSAPLQRVVLREALFTPQAWSQAETPGTALLQSIYAYDGNAALDRVARPTSTPQADALLRLLASRLEGGEIAGLHTTASAAVALLARGVTLLQVLPFLETVTSIPARVFLEDSCAAQRVVLADAAWEQATGRVVTATYHDAVSDAIAGATAFGNGPGADAITAVHRRAYDIVYRAAHNLLRATMDLKHQFVRYNPCEAGLLAAAELMEAAVSIMLSPELPPHDGVNTVADLTAGGSLRQQLVACFAPSAVAQVHHHDFARAAAASGRPLPLVAADVDAEGRALDAAQLSLSCNKILSVACMTLSNMSRLAFASRNPHAYAPSEAADSPHGRLHYAWTWCSVWQSCLARKLLVFTEDDGETAAAAC